MIRKVRFTIFASLIFLLVFSIISGKVFFFFTLAIYTFAFTIGVDYLNPRRLTDLLDPRMVLIISFTIYNLAVPWMFAIDRVNTIELKLFPDYAPFTIATILNSSIASTFYFFGLVLGICSFTSIRARPAFLKPTVTEENSYSYFKYWLSISIAASLIRYLPYVILGSPRTIYALGITGSLEEVYSVLTSNFALDILRRVFTDLVWVISFPLAYWGMLKSKKVRTSQKLYFWFYVIAINSYAVFVTLRRLRSIMIIIALCSVYFAVKQNRNHTLERNIFKILLIVLLVLFAFSLFRSSLHVLLELGIQAFLKDVESTLSRGPGIQYQTEFSGVYAVLLSAIQYSDNSRFAGSYIHGLLYPIPVVNDVLQFVGLEESFSPTQRWLMNQYSEVFEAGGGLSFSPVAEAFLAYGYLGCVVFGFLFGAFFGFFGKSKNLFTIVLLGILAFGFPRSSSTVFFYQLFNIVFYFFVFNGIFASLKRKRAKRG